MRTKLLRKDFKGAIVPLPKTLWISPNKKLKKPLEETNIVI